MRIALRWPHIGKSMTLLRSSIWSLPLRDLTLMIGTLLIPLMSLEIRLMRNGSLLMRSFQSASRLSKRGFLIYSPATALARPIMNGGLRKRFRSGVRISSMRSASTCFGQLHFRQLSVTIIMCPAFSIFVFHQSEDQ